MVRVFDQLFLLGVLVQVGVGVVVGLEKRETGNGTREMGSAAAFGLSHDRRAEGAGRGRTYTRAPGGAGGAFEFTPEPCGRTF